MRPRRVAAMLAAASLMAGGGWCQTVEQSEESIAYLKKNACARWDGVQWVFDPTPPVNCLSDLDCGAPPTYCRHQSSVLPKSDLYPDLEFPNPPSGAGSGEAHTRYVPLCEDGSGDHEYSLSNGSAGTQPTCAPEDYIRCADGVRPFYQADAGTENNWLIHAGGGGHGSSPNTSNDAIWALSHTQAAGAYSVTTSPKVRGELEGIFDESALNPFSTYNRVWIPKCTPDRWLGNRAHHNLQDFLEPLRVEVITGACSDTDGSGTASCQDEDCICTFKTLAAPRSPNHEYSVYYHGKRIARAVLSDIFGRITTYNDYPGDIEDVFDLPALSSKILFHCHSNGCNGLQNGHIDDLHARIDTALGGDVDVRALFNGSLGGSAEAERTVSEYDCVNNDSDEFPDNPGDIDDSLSLYDHLIDSRSITLQPMSMAPFVPGPVGTSLQKLVDWWDPSASGYAEPVDASCLAQHCPIRPSGWANEAACGPCNDSRHVLLNHLATPFLYNQAQKDSVLGRLMQHCDDGADPTRAVICDVVGNFTGVNIRDTHWRKLVRKMIADLFRSGELDRCEGGFGNEWPYNHIMILAPNWTDHGALSEPNVAGKLVDLTGSGAGRPMAAWAHDYVHLSDPTAPAKAICLVEDFVDENEFDFDDVAKGNVAVCLEPGVSSER